MVIDGVVAHVMESFPLQLRVEAGGRMYQIALGEDTRVTQAGVRIDPGKITPGARVRVSGRDDAGDAGGLVAESIEISS